MQRVNHTSMVRYLIYSILNVAKGHILLFYTDPEEIPVNIHGVAMEKCWWIKSEKSKRNVILPPNLLSKDFGPDFFLNCSKEHRLAQTDDHSQSNIIYISWRGVNWMYIKTQHSFWLVCHDKIEPRSLCTRSFLLSLTYVSIYNKTLKRSSCNIWKNY